jgi:hypothetical protein
MKIMYETASCNGWHRLLPSHLLVVDSQLVKKLQAKYEASAAVLTGGIGNPEMSLTNN